MLGVELLGVGEGHFAHFDVGDDEPGLFDSGNDFADVFVAVRFDHSEGSTKR